MKLQKSTELELELELELEYEIKLEFEIEIKGNSFTPLCFVLLLPRKGSKKMVVPELSESEVALAAALCYQWRRTENGGGCPVRNSKKRNSEQRGEGMQKIRRQLKGGEGKSLQTSPSATTTKLPLATSPYLKKKLQKRESED